jgi:hypothetical protein
MRRVRWVLFGKCILGIFAGCVLGYFANFFAGTSQLIVSYIALAIIAVSSITYTVLNAMVVFGKSDTTSIEDGDRL